MKDYIKARLSLLMAGAGALKVSFIGYRYIH